MKSESSWFLLPPSLKTSLWLSNETGESRETSGNNTRKIVGWKRTNGTRVLEETVCVAVVPKLTICSTIFSHISLIYFNDYTITSSLYTYSPNITISSPPFKCEKKMYINRRFVTNNIIQKRKKGKKKRSRKPWCIATIVEEESVPFSQAINIRIDVTRIDVERRTKETIDQKRSSV